VSGAGSSLKKWRRKLAESPSTAVLVLQGDSTTDYATSASAITDYLRAMAIQPGEPLSGMQASNIVALGYNGMALQVWLDDTSKLAALVSAQPDLIVASWLINDVRLGLCDWETARSRLISYIDTVTAAIPNVEILLRVPNPLLTSNVGGLNFVQGADGSINPVGAAQAYSTLIRTVYLSISDVYENVSVWDAQAEIFGTVSRATNPIMADQLHPTPRGSNSNGVPINGGYVEIAKGMANRIGLDGKGFVLSTNQYQSYRTGYLCQAAGNGYFDIYTQDNTGAPASQYPLTTSDLVFAHGFASPISLSGATILRPFAGTAIRILKTGDWTSLAGRKLDFAGAHPDMTTGDRQIVSVDIPSTAAGAITTATATVIGARTGALQDATAVACTPPAAFVSAGLVLLGCYPSANDTVTIAVQNPTGAAVDLASNSFAFWLIR